MKKYAVIPFIIMIACYVNFAQPETGWKRDQKDNGKNLVLTHPTVYNLKVFKNLLDKELIKIENCRIIGVYHEDERYDYSKCANYLDTASFTQVDIYLHELHDTIREEELFRENALSDDYLKIFSNSKGVVFFGGADIPPEIYNEKTHLLTSIYDPFRHYFELSFLFHLLGGFQNSDFEPLLNENPDYLIYGFCLGMQTMNVATGGTMIQDIPYEIYDIQYIEDVLKFDNDRLHRNYFGSTGMAEDLLSGYFHRILPGKTSYIEELDLDNPTPTVYSNHHQAVEKVGKGFQVMGTSMDGKVVEILKHETYSNVIGVQFHPEALLLYDDKQRYRISPEDTVSFTGQQMLLETRSMEFHRKFWSDFQRRLNRSP